jgi:hypothetical protein
MAMTRKARQLAELAQLAALVSDRALAPMASLRARIDAAGGAERALADHRAALTGVTGIDPALAALLARQAERLRRRQADAMIALAGLEAQLEEARATARPAYGRRLALERLAREARGQR